MLLTLHRPSAARAALLFATALVLASCQALEPPEALEPPPDLTLHRADLDIYRRGRLDARASLDELRYTRSRSRVDGSGVKAKPLRGEEEDGILTAGEAVAQLGEGALLLSHDVSWQWADGTRADTQRCEVDLRSGLARGDTHMTLTGPDFRIQAPAFSAQLGANRELRMLGGAHAVYGSHEPQSADKGTP